MLIFTDYINNSLASDYFFLCNNICIALNKVLGENLKLSLIINRSGPLRSLVSVCNTLGCEIVKHGSFHKQR